MPAFAGEQDFTLVNQTGIAIHGLYVSPHKSDDWGKDILKEMEEVTLHFKDGKAWADFK